MSEIRARPVLSISSIARIGPTWSAAKISTQVPQPVGWAAAFEMGIK
jgi:hypothetical protein